MWRQNSFVEMWRQNSKSGKDCLVPSGVVVRWSGGLALRIQIENAKSKKLFYFFNAKSKNTKFEKFEMTEKCEITKCEFETCKCFMSL